MQHRQIGTLADPVDESHRWHAHQPRRRYAERAADDHRQCQRRARTPGHRIRLRGGRRQLHSTAHRNTDGSLDVLVVGQVMTDLYASGGGSDDYAKRPKGNLDVTGRYFIWTTNLGGNRLDAFLVKIPGGTPVSLDGTTVPSAPQIVDSEGAVWTIGAGQVILRNGVQAASGYGSRILWKNANVYVLGTAANWWQWTGNGWLNVGPTTPGGGSTGGGASPDGTTVPTTATQI